LQVTVGVDNGRRLAAKLYDVSVIQTFVEGQRLVNLEGKRGKMLRRGVSDNFGNAVIASVYD
jgi:hypothetical protein